MISHTYQQDGGGQGGHLHKVTGQYLINAEINL